MSTMGRLQEAGVLYERAAKTFNAPALVASSAENSLRLGCPYEAILQFTRALAYTQMGKYRRRLADIYAGIAQDFAEQGRFDIAIGCLGEAQNFAPSVRTLKLLAQAQERRGTIMDAVGTLSEILKIDRFDIETAFKLAQLYESEGWLVSAREAYEVVRRLDPDFMDVSDRILSITLTLSDKQDSPVWKRSKDLYLLGKLALDYEQYSRATQMFIRAESLGTKMPQAHFFLGKSLEKQGKLAEAKDEYKLAFSLDPSDARPLVSLLELYRLFNDQQGIEWVRDKIESFMPEYECQKVVLALGRSAIAPVEPSTALREVLQGISLDELSIRYEDWVCLTAVWEEIPAKIGHPQTVELGRDKQTYVLKLGGRNLLVAEIRNLLRGAQAFQTIEGAFKVVASSDDRPPSTPGPDVIMMKTSENILRAVTVSERVPVDPGRNYLLFCRFWASAPGAYVGKTFFDQGGRSLFFNRYGAGRSKDDWNVVVDYFAPPREARTISLFLILEHPSAIAYFDDMVLASVSRASEVFGWSGSSGSPQ